MHASRSIGEYWSNLEELIWVNQIVSPEFVNQIASPLHKLGSLGIAGILVVLRNIESQIISSASHVPLTLSFNFRHLSDSDGTVDQQARYAPARIRVYSANKLCRQLTGICREIRCRDTQIEPYVMLERELNSKARALDGGLASARRVKGLYIPSAGYLA